MLKALAKASPEKFRVPGFRHWDFKASQANGERRFYARFFDDETLCVIRERDLSWLLARVKHGTQEELETMGRWADPTRFGFTWLHPVYKPW